MGEQGKISVRSEKAIRNSTIIYLFKLCITRINPFNSPIKVDNAFPGNYRLMKIPTYTLPSVLLVSVV